MIHVNSFVSLFVNQFIKSNEVHLKCAPDCLLIRTFLFRLSRNLLLVTLSKLKENNNNNKFSDVVLGKNFLFGFLINNLNGDGGLVVNDVN